MSYFKVMWGKISDTVGRAIRIDGSTHAIKTTTTENGRQHSAIVTKVLRMECNEKSSSCYRAYGMAV